MQSIISWAEEGGGNLKGSWTSVRELNHLVPPHIYGEKFSSEPPSEVVRVIERHYVLRNLHFTGNKAGSE